MNVIFKSSHLNIYRGCFGTEEVNESDRVGLRDVHEAFKQKHAKETELDTRRVKANPKMINIFFHSQYVSLRFKDINYVTSISHLKMFLKGLAAPTNSFEQQAVDLLKVRIEELSVIIKANKKDYEEKLRRIDYLR